MSSPKLPPHAELLQLRGEGWSDRDLADRYGVRVVSVEAAFVRVPAGYFPQPAAPCGGWRDRAACSGHDPVLWFGPDDETDAERRAREDAACSWCWGCPVVDDCRRWARATRQEFGVWGAETETAREEHLAAAAEAAAAAEKGARRPPQRREVCGTEAGYRAHRRHGEDACRRCLQANAEATRRKQGKARPDNERQDQPA